MTSASGCAPWISASVTPAYDGWYDNADGSHTFLIGYYNRNWNEAVDVPLGPNNKFEPGDPDRGQPTHFYPNRNFGMFAQHSMGALSRMRCLAKRFLQLLAQDEMHTQSERDLLTRLAEGLDERRAAARVN